MSGFAARVWGVSQINRYIRGLMDSDVILSGLFCEGEISNLKYHGSGHVYFSCKDAGGAINCVMFKSNADKLGDLRLRDGMRVILYGAVSVYEKAGQYQLYVEILRAEGCGGLFAAFSELKARLEREGLFDAARKRPIPAFASAVAVITSPTGAVIRDIINIARRRNPGVKIILIPTAVQGEDAPGRIAWALDAASEWGRADAVIVARGGGSAEDLLAFNDEAVARAVYRSKIPVISAVGHQTDYTLCDFAADLRAETPSAAAELAVFDLEAAVSRLKGGSAALRAVARSRFEDARYDLESMAARLKSGTETRLAGFKRSAENAARALDLLSPLNVLRRGYAIVYGGDGKIVSSAHAMRGKSAARIEFSDGSVGIRDWRTENAQG